MKNKLFILFYLTVFAQINAQNLQVQTIEGENISGQIFMINGLPDASVIEAHLAVANIGNTDISVKVRKIEKNVVLGAANTFCWGTCVLPSVFVSPQAITIASQTTDQTNFSGDFIPNNTVGTSEIMYSFFNEANPADSAYVTVKYSVSSFTLYDLNNQDITNSICNLEAPANQSLIEAHVKIKNNSGDALNVKVKKLVIQSAEGSENTFCWGSCMLPFVTESPEPITINAGSTNENDFSGDFSPNNTVGTSTIAYTFFDTNNTADSVQITINFTTTLAGFQIAFYKGSFSTLHPNPASNFTKFSYEIGKYSKARCDIYNLLGSKVQSIELIKQSGEIYINVKNFKQGIYICSFIVDEITVKTNKLIIR